MSQMSGGISVNYEEMSGLQANLSKATQQLTEAIKQAQSAVTAVAGVSWQGQASKAFAGLHDQWNTSANQVMQALGGMSDFLQKSALPGFQQTDSSLASGIANQGH